MTPDEKSKLEQILADAAAGEAPPESLRRRVFSPEPSSEPRPAARRGFRVPRELWPVLAAGILFSLILWRVVQFTESPGGTAPGGAQDGDPKELVRALGAEDIKVRERAAGDLLAIGEKARAALEEAASSAEPEIRLRAKDLLAALDQRVRRGKLDRHAGVLGETGVLWIEAAAFDLVAEEQILPAGMKPALVSASGFTFGMVTFENGQAKASEIKTLGMTATSVAGPTLLCRQRFGPATNQLAAPGWSGPGAPPHGLGAWFKQNRSLRGTDLFRHWPQLRRQSLVFLALARPNARSSDTLRKGLEEAVAHERAEVRAAALHVLRHYAQPQTVELALKKLDDAAPHVRTAARETLQGLVNAPEGAAEETRAWWAGLDAKRRSEILIEQSKAETVRRPCACETEGK